MSIFTDEIVVSNTPDITVSTGVNVNNFPATQTVNGTVTVQQPTGANLHVSVDGNVNTISGALSTSTVSQVALTANTNATLVAPNAATRKVILFVPKGTTQIKLGAVASTTSFTYIVTTNNTTVEITNWAGQIDAISNNAQSINVTILS